MATRFLRYDSDPILRKKCKAVLKVDDKIRQLLDDMLDTLHETENGAALAANQVGVLKRLVVIDFNDTRLKLVNPQIIIQALKAIGKDNVTETHLNIIRRRLSDEEKVCVLEEAKQAAVWVYDMVKRICEESEA